MTKAALTGNILFGKLLVKRKELYPLVNGVFIYGLHIVILRLTHVYSVKPRRAAKSLDIVISSSAEMNGTSVF